MSRSARLMSPARAHAGTRRGDVVALAAWSGLVVAAVVAGRWLMASGHRMFVASPPLTGNPGLRIGPAILPAVASAVLVAVHGPRSASRLSWRRLLVVAGVVAAGWAFLLALSGGSSEVTDPLLGPLQYLHDVPEVRRLGPGAFLDTFTERIDGYATHVRAHPPGLVLALWGMDALGAGGAWPAAVLMIAVGASAVAAVLLAVREVAGEAVARRAAPFVAVAPVALSVATSGDALFMGVGAWSVAALVLATGRSGRRADLLAVAAGLLFGVGLMLSYGLALLAVIPVGVAAVRHTWRPVLVAAVAALAVLVAVGMATGFWWPDGLAATRREYLEGISRRRPYGYFTLLANPAAFALILGPATAVAVARLARSRRRSAGLAILVGAALAAALLADLSGMSKAEVERIWIPFAIWVLPATAFLVPSAADPNAARPWLALQCATAIAIQAAVRSPW